MEKNYRVHSHSFMKKKMFVTFTLQNLHFFFFFGGGGGGGGIAKSNKFSICPKKWKIHYFQASQNLGRVHPHYNVLEYWDT